MNRGAELSVLYNTSTPTKIKPTIHAMNYYHKPSSQIFHDQVIRHDDQQNNTTIYQQMHSFSPPLSIASSSSSSGSSLSSSPPSIKKLPRPSKKLHKLNNSHRFSTSPPPLIHINTLAAATIPIQSKKTASEWNFTWLVFMNEKWVPFDIINQTRLEQTLTVDGTFVDIQDSHFPKVKRVRVFPRNNYLSYLGVKYRLSRVMQPDAYLDHVGVAEARKSSSTSSC
jgi:hypothetical protein